MPQLACNIAEPRLPQTQKCMKHREDILCVKINIDAKTGDIENFTKKDSLVFFKTLPTTSTRGNLFCLQLYA